LLMPSGRSVLPLKRLPASSSAWLEALSTVAETYVWRPEQWTDGTIEAVLRATP